jgi:hypothetical protein
MRATVILASLRFPLLFLKRPPFVPSLSGNIGNPDVNVAAICRNRMHLFRGATAIAGSKETKKENGREPGRLLTPHALS